MVFKHAHAGICAVCGKYKEVIADDDNLCFKCFYKQEKIMGFPLLKELFKKEKDDEDG